MWHGHVSAVLQFSDRRSNYIQLANKSKTKSLSHVQKLAQFDGCWLRFPAQVQPITDLLSLQLTVQHLMQCRHML